MKKVSKVFLIIAGVFGVGVVISMFLMAGYFGLGAIGSLISFIVNTIQQGDTTPMLPMIPASFVMAFLGTLLLLGSLFALLGTIFAFVGLKKNPKKAIHIVSLIFSALSGIIGFVFLPLGLVALLVLLILLIIIIILLLTPAGWIFVGYIAISLGALLFALLSILGNVLALVAIAKQKKEEEIGPEEMVEEIE